MCKKKKKKNPTETKNTIFDLGVVVVDKSTTNADIVNYSTHNVAPVVAGNETADRNEVWTSTSILLYVAAHSSRHVTLSAIWGFTIRSCCTAFPITNLIGRPKLRSRGFTLPNFFSLCCSGPANWLSARWKWTINLRWKPHALRSWTLYVPRWEHFIWQNSPVLQPLVRRAELGGRGMGCVAAGQDGLTLPAGSPEDGVFVHMWLRKIICECACVCLVSAQFCAVTASSGLWSLALIRKAEDGTFDLFVEMQGPLFVPKKKKKVFLAGW